jgi:prepilin peptidase CpaA
MHSAAWNLAWTLVLASLALSLAVWAGWLDWRVRRIPNWLTVPALGAGLVANTLAWGWQGLKAEQGLKAGLEGAGLGLALLLPFVLLRGLGAGDWKLMGALGALLGPSRLLVVLLGTIFIAGAMATVQMIRHGRVKETLYHVGVLFVILITFGVRGQRHNLTLDNPGLMKLPFGVAAAVSTLLLFGTLSALRILRS